MKDASLDAVICRYQENPSHAGALIRLTLAFINRPNRDQAEGRASAAMAHRARPRPGSCVRCASRSAALGGSIMAGKVGSSQAEASG